MTWRDSLAILASGVATTSVSRALFVSNYLAFDFDKILPTGTSIGHIVEVKGHGVCTMAMPMPGIKSVHAAIFEGDVDAAIATAKQRMKQIQCN